jgi:hypothetical protein
MGIVLPGRSKEQIELQVERSAKSYTNLPMLGSLAFPM